MTINSNEPELGLLRTEQVDAKFQLLDVMSISELLQAMNESDTEVPKAVNAMTKRSGANFSKRGWCMSPICPSNARKSMPLKRSRKKVCRYSMSIDQTIDLLLVAISRTCWLSKILSVPSFGCSFLD